MPARLHESKTMTSHVPKHIASSRTQVDSHQPNVGDAAATTLQLSPTFGDMAHGGKPRHQIVVTWQ